LSIGMVPGDNRGSRRDVVPMKKQACAVLKFDLFPQTEPMNPLFEPVMIRRHDDKQTDGRD